MARGKRTLDHPLILLCSVACAACSQSTSGELPPPSGACVADSNQTLYRAVLRDDWAIQSSAFVKDDDARVADWHYQTSGWHHATLPATVVAALVADGTFSDPYLGMEMRSLPGMDYAIHDAFWAYPMGDQSPFRVPWWYRTQFHLPSRAPGQRTWIRFDGINYRADVWLNGRKVADSSSVVGAFRTFEIDVTDAVAPCADNVLALKIASPQVGELGWNWVDWAPFPPDKNMGIWENVTISSSGPVRLRAPYLKSRVPSLTEAILTAGVDAMNATSAPVTVVIRGALDDKTFSKTLTLAAGESRTVTFGADEFASLHAQDPALWWPANMGDQALSDLTFVAEVGGQRSDEAAARVGIREVTSTLDEKSQRVFQVNGQKVLIRGAGWTPDLLLRHPADRMEDEIRLVRDMNLNAIRLEGKVGLAPLYDLCDRYGVMVIAGVCCCDYWERYPTWNEENKRVAPQSITDQVRLLRSHPSALLWMNGSDNIPPPEIEKQYLDGIGSVDWPNPVAPSAAGHESPLTGPSGVKMTGPYEYVPPSYWYVDHAHGGAFGFNSETSMGAAPPPIESLKRFLAPEHLWPIDEQWTFHAGNGTGLDLFGLTEAMEARHGAAIDLADFDRKAQLLAYEGERAMFEAFGRNKYQSTGVIQWMLNNPWPSVVWHLYDDYLKAGGGYFGAKKANEPLHVQYSYDDRSIVVVNSTREAAPRLSVIAEVWSLAGKRTWQDTRTVDVGPDAVVTAMTVPQPQDGSETVLVRLLLADEKGTTVSRNLYWLSAKPDVFDADSNTVSMSDFSALGTLPATKVKAAATRASQKGTETLSVTISNPGASIAFFMRLSAIKGTKGLEGEEVLPSFWDDNEVTLMPGEQRTLVVQYRTADLEGTLPSLRVEGWNVPVIEVPVN